MKIFQLLFLRAALSFYSRLSGCIQLHHAWDIRLCITFLLRCKRVDTWYSVAIHVFTMCAYLCAHYLLKYVQINQNFEDIGSF